ncbi:MAG: MopE-related protein [Myxococcota bacterium]
MFRSSFFLLLVAFAFGCSRDLRLGPRQDAGTDARPEVDSDVVDAAPEDGGNDAPPLCVDEDGDGYGAGCALGPDCNDDARDVSPAETERCNGEDDDCDERIDEEADAPSCTLLDGVCAGARAECGDFGPCGADEYGADYEVDETRCDGLDNDCDGTMDEGCSCTNGMTQSCGLSEGACTSGTQECVSGVWGSCEGSVGPAAEICNGVDDNCDMVVDNPADLTPPACALQEGVCAGSEQRCAGASGWAACAGTASYGARYELSETSCDGVDNDCDGAVDEGCNRPVTFASGSDHSCVIDELGRVKCWGRNIWATLGLGDRDNRGDDPGEMATLPFVELGTGRTAVSIATGEAQTCVILDDGALKCWGNNQAGALGLGNTEWRGDDPGEMGDALPAIDLGTGRSAQSVVVGGGHVCALLDDASVKCWGSNTSGQLGQGDTEWRGDDPGEMGDALPSVDLGGPVRAITAGAGHTCALLFDGALKCWGSNNFGDLGLEDMNHRGDEPGEMGAALPSVDLGTGRRAILVVADPAGTDTCALLDDGAVKCWGITHGELGGSGFPMVRGDEPGEMGDDMPSQRFGARVEALVVGGEQTCVALDDATVRCWGRNLRGELGIGSTTRVVAANDRGDRLAVTELGTGRRAVTLTAGIRFTCARLDDDTVKCWGRFHAHGDGEDRGDEPGEMGDALPVIDL